MKHFIPVADWYYVCRINNQTYVTPIAGWSVHQDDRIYGMIPKLVRSEGLSHLWIAPKLDHGTYKHHDQLDAIELEALDKKMSLNCVLIE